MTFTMLIKCCVSLVFLYLLVYQASTNPVTIEPSVPEAHNSSQKLGGKAQWQDTIELVREYIETRIALIKNNNENTLELRNKTNERLQALVTRYERTVFDKTAQVLNDYHMTRDLATSIQLEIDVNECDRIISTLQTYAISTARFRDRIVEDAANIVEFKKNVDERTEISLINLNIFKTRTLQCNVKTDIATALNCADQLKEKASSIYNQYLHYISQTNFALQYPTAMFEARVQEALEKAILEELPIFHATAAILIPPAKQCIRDKIAEIQRTKNVTPNMDDVAETTTHVTTEASTEAPTQATTGSY